MVSIGNSAYLGYVGCQFGCTRHQRDRDKFVLNVYVLLIFVFYHSN